MGTMQRRHSEGDVLAQQIRELQAMNRDLRLRLDAAETAARLAEESSRRAWRVAGLGGTRRAART